MNEIDEYTDHVVQLECLDFSSLFKAYSYIFGYLGMFDSQDEAMSEIMRVNTAYLKK